MNILPPGAKRKDGELAESDAISLIAQGEGTTSLALPQSWSDEDWRPNGTHPIEVIDGQHRLWAFDSAEEDLDFDLPVVAFYNLDVSWQAYLFWTVNIKPKKINASLAFDLYPLLREQDWLLAGEGIMVYRETRAQELTEALWATPASPWYQRINMLGETGVKRHKPVTQAAFVRSLTATFVRAWKSTRSALGGLYGGAQSDYEGLDWPRVQQAAFLIYCWKTLAEAIEESEHDWAEDIRSQEDVTDEMDPAFAGSFTLLASDQGVRPVLSTFNDLTYVVSSRVELSRWQLGDASTDVTPESVSTLLGEIPKHPIAKFISELARAMASFDWRNSKAPNLSDSQRNAKLVFRGSGGYVELRRQLLEHIAENSEDSALQEAVDVVSRRI